MAARLTVAERARIEELCGLGWTCNAIAEEIGRSSDTVSRVAREIGHKFGAKQLAAAHEAQASYGAERRAKIARKMADRAEELLDAMGAPTTVFNFGGKDNTYAEKKLDKPPVRDQRDLMHAANTAVRTIIDIDKHDNRADDVAAVDEWLKHMTGEGAT